MKFDSNDGKASILKKIKDGIELFPEEKKKIHLSDLLITDDNHVTYLEYYCKGKHFLFLPNNLQKEIENSKEAIYILTRCRDFSFLGYLRNEDIFFEQFKDNKTLIDFVFESDSGEMDIFLMIFKKRVEIIDYLVKYDKIDYLRCLSDELEKNLFVSDEGQALINRYIHNVRFVKELMGVIPFETLLDYYSKHPSIDFLKSMGDRYYKEEDLLCTIGDNKTLFEEFLDNNIIHSYLKLKSRYLTNKQSVDILIQKNRFDLLCYANLDLLLSMYQDDKSYFDFMIEALESGQDISFEKIFSSYEVYSVDTIAKCLLKMAKNNVLDMISITPEMLLHKFTNDNASVIELLINMDRNITLSSILPKCNVQNNLQLAVMLETLGIDSHFKNPMMDSGSGFLGELISDYNKEYDRNIESVCEDLLVQLRDLFYADGKSDKEFVDAIITSYRYLTSGDGNSIFIQEVAQIIEIKKKYFDRFVINRVNSDSYFSPIDGTINLSKSLICTVNHEMTHALHYYLANLEEPENFSDIIKRVRDNPETIKKVVLYLREYGNILNRLDVKPLFERLSEFYFNKYSGEDVDKLKEFLSKSKEDKMKEFQGSYPRDVLETIFDKFYSFDEFIRQRKMSDSNAIISFIMSTQYAPFITISDIIDAIFAGKFRGGKLLDDAGNVLQCYYGHGMKYYSDKDTIFLEIIAQYGTMMKSKNSGVINLLRDIVGDELVDLLDSFYRERIINSLVYSNGEVKGHAR